MSRRRSSALATMDLLPSSYQRKRRVQQLSRSWAAVIMILLAAFCCAVGESVLRAHRQASNNAQLACTAMPLQAIRNNVIALQTQNRKHTEWCDMVESARPDDSTLQTLAAIAVASQ